MKKQIRIGIMGAGRMAGWFSEGLQVVEDAARYAVASRTLEKAEAFATAYGFEKAYGSYAALLEDASVDLVYIATPVMEHYACIKQCLEAGKPVLCEKSLTVNAKQAEEMVSLAREKGLFFMEAMWTLCQPGYRQMRQWIDEGLIGEIRGIECTFFTAAGKGHRLYQKEVGGGALLDLGFYPVTYATALLGTEPTQVLTHTVLGEAGVDYLDSLVLTYANGAFAHLATGLGVTKRADAFILGSKGRISIDDDLFFQAQKITAVDFDNAVLATADTPFLQNGYEYEAMEAVRCLQEGLLESPLVPLNQSVTVMRILDHCRQQAGFRFDFE